MNLIKTSNKHMNSPKECVSKGICQSNRKSNLDFGFCILLLSFLNWNEIVRSTLFHSPVCEGIIMNQWKFHNTLTLFRMLLFHYTHEKPVALLSGFRMKIQNYVIVTCDKADLSLSISNISNRASPGEYLK